MIRRQNIQRNFRLTTSFATDSVSSAIGIPYIETRHGVSPMCLLETFQQTLR
jgi:hypothetical protein